MTLLFIKLESIVFLRQKQFVPEAIYTSSIM